MEFVLNQLVLETTRKCNLQCKHCMRGEKQNVDLTKNIVDMIFNNKEIRGIKTICFTGGEPTLNADIIIYTIDKIINEHLEVGNIVMETNGQIFNQKLIEAFNRFNEYRNNYINNYLNNTFKGNAYMREQIRKNNIDENVYICFSVDKFHQKIEKDVKFAYVKNARGLKFNIISKMAEDEIYKTGNATVGKEFKYRLNPISYYQEANYYIIPNALYITVDGNITSEVIGQFSDIDKTNLGHISKVTIKDILTNYGNPLMGTKPITTINKTLQKSINKDRENYDIK